MDNVNHRFKSGSIVAKYIYINVGVFILIQLIQILFRLFLKEAEFLSYFEMSSNPVLLAHRPWTMIAYMFVHIDFLHIFFNMLWLYWFGKLFLQFYTGRQFSGIYLLGGIAGGALFLLAYNVFPYFQKLPDIGLIGASASVMAIVFAVSFYRKEYTIRLLFIGQIKLIYLAFVVLIIDILAITSENAGGHIAHIGGALSGIFFAFQYQRAKENYSQPETKRQRESDDAYLRRKQEESRIIDEILDKLKRSGYESLSSDEKKQLFNASRR